MSHAIEASADTAAVPAGRASPAPRPRRAPGEARWLAVAFLAPALVLLSALVLYPAGYSFVRSLFGDDRAGGIGSFVALGNYREMFSDPGILKALKNNVIWVVVAPTVVTMVGLVFAVLSERIRWSTVFKTVLFMPMAISFLASGVTFEMLYSDQPSRGLANAVVVGIHDTFRPTAGYPNVHARDATVMTGSAAIGYTTIAGYSAAATVILPMAGLDLTTAPPSSAGPALLPAAGAGPGGLYGVIWNDFRPGGGGHGNTVDAGELGLGGMRVQAVRDGGGPADDKVVATATADAHGVFRFPTLTSGSYRLKLPASNFGAPYHGISWLGPNLITPAIIVAYLWVYAGFAMVLLAAGMASIPRDALEAARIDGATEWQVFRRVTAPLLAPVLLVVLVTLVINVLKVFDLVFIISQGAGANGHNADVLATQLYSAFSAQRYGLASAIGVVLVLLVLPAMAFNIRRFRREDR